MITNIGSKVDLLATYIQGLTGINTLFGTRVYAGKPVVQPSGLYCYFEMVNNTAKIQDASTGILIKNALFDFYIVAVDKSTPDVVIYEALDTLSNVLRTTFSSGSIDLSGFTLYTVEEGNQSGILRDEKENPLLIAQYIMSYKYLY